MFPLTPPKHVKLLFSSTHVWEQNEERQFKKAFPSVGDKGVIEVVHNDSKIRLLQQTYIHQPNKGWT